MINSMMIFMMMNSTYIYLGTFILELIKKRIFDMIIVA